MKQGRRARFASRGRERAWWLLGAAALVAVLWAIAQVLGWPLWVRAVLAGLAAVVALVIPELRARARQDDTRARLVEQRLAVPAGHRQLPQVRPIRPADEIDNVKPILGMKKRHEETKDATNGRSGTVWGR